MYAARARNVPLGVKALKNILACHGKAYDIIHSKIPDAMVSIAHNMAALAPWNKWNPLDKLLSKIAKYFYNHSLLDAFITGTLSVKFPFKKAVEIPCSHKGQTGFLRRKLLYEDTYAVQSFQKDGGRVEAQGY